MSALAAVLKPGLATTVQDLGRAGRRHLGVPLSGAADPLSLALANAALGNPANAAALECTLKGPSLRFERVCAFALAGADMAATLNKKAVPLYTRIAADAGGVLTLGTAAAGARAYIAFEGGLAGGDFLGSLSTYAPAALGGIDGRTLAAGDMLFSAGLAAGAARDIPDALRPRLAHDAILRALPGPEAEQLSTDDMERFFVSAWTVDRRADRMGARLAGRMMEGAESAMASSAVFPGTVQCPPDGAPFLLLADAQTVGGYPRIAQVIAADLHVAGQLRPGDRVWFRRTTAETARDIAAKKSALLADFLPNGFFR